jgi:uncharacterized membrane protein YhiD involved in acid resistance
MTIEAFINSLMVSDTNSLGLVDILLTMGIPFLLSFPITYIYRFTQKNNNYSTAFVHTIFLFSTLSAIITLLIGSNIARAFGLVGALSIIRFRNALKDPLDAVYIFWALAVGMAAGTGLHFAAVLLVAFCSVMMLFLHYTGYGSAKFVDSVLKVVMGAKSETECLPGVQSALKKHTKASSQINVLFDTNKDTKTYIYNIRINKSSDTKPLEESLSKISGVESIHHLNRESFLFSGI